MPSGAAVIVYEGARFASSAGTRPAESAASSARSPRSRTRRTASCRTALVQRVFFSASCPGTSQAAPLHGREKPVETSRAVANFGNRKGRVCGPFALQGRQDSNLQPQVLEV